MQTSYLKLIDGRAPFARQSEFRTFLFGVIRRTASEDRRRRAIRATLSLGILCTESDAERVEHSRLAEIIRDERSRELIAALTKLSARQRDVLHLVFYQDLTIVDAAKVLGVSVGSARIHYERGKARLRQILGADANHGA